jgi:hypothetical protein
VREKYHQDPAVRKLFDITEAEKPKREDEKESWKLGHQGQIGGEEA